MQRAEDRPLVGELGIQGNIGERIRAPFHLDVATAPLHVQGTRGTQAQEVKRNEERKTQREEERMKEIKRSREGSREIKVKRRERERNQQIKRERERSRERSREHQEHQ